MSYHFDVLTEVATGALEEFGHSRFTSRQFGEALAESQSYLPRWDRYPKPLRRGATAGQVLRRLRVAGLVMRVGPHPQRYWQVIR